MKKLLLSIVLSAAYTLPLLAAGTPPDDGKNVSVTGTEIVRIDGETVSVLFQLHVGTEVTAKNSSLILRPIIVGTEEQSELPPVIIRGERAKSVVENRAMSAAGVDSQGRYVTTNGAVLDYYATIPWQVWMRGSQLIFNGLSVGKGRPFEVNVGTVADNLLTGQSDSAFDAPSEPLAAEQQQGMAPGQQQSANSGQRSANTIGDELASRFTFVESVERYNQARENSSLDAIFDYNMPLVFGKSTAKQEDDVSRFVEMTREGALYVRFDRGSTMVGRDVGQNNSMLVDLISAIRVLDANPQTRIAQVVVVGFSAPEGSLDEKETLALERAAATRDFLTANSHIEPSVISTYNGSVDWVTLRALVAESNMPDKYKVLDLIDNIPAWGNTRDKDRLTYLQELNNGDAFLYIREHFFPQLRQTGAYIKVYYENVL
jgi:outer membrane protein OmpA-like peptidoglycan-associated protein